MDTSYWKAYVGAANAIRALSYEVTSGKALAKPGKTKIRRCKLDPGLKGPWFQRFNLIKRSLLST